MRGSVERSTTTIGGTVVPLIAFIGELDLATAGLLEDAALDVLEDVPAAGLVVDMSKVTFADSRGIAALLTIRGMLDGRRVYLRRVSRPIFAAMRMMRIDPLFAIQTDDGPVDHPNWRRQPG
jgi:anti-anti-sigma factor